MEQTSLSHRPKSRSVSREYVEDDTDYRVDLKRHSSNNPIPPRKEKSNGIRGLIRHIMPKGKQNVAFRPKPNLPESIDEVRKLIGLYRQFNSLYNPRNPQYERKGADKIYYSDIASHFPGTTAREIQEFIKELRTIFEQEYWAIENERCLYGEVLEPSIEYFNDFLFLVPYMYNDESFPDFRSDVEIRRNSLQPEELDQITFVSTPPNDSYVVLEEDFGSSIVSEQPSLRTYLTDYKVDAYDKYIPHTPITGNAFCGLKKKKEKQLDVAKQERKKLEELDRKKLDLEKKKLEDQEKKKIVELEKKRLEEIKTHDDNIKNERRPAQTRPKLNKQEPVKVNESVSPPKQSNLKKQTPRPAWLGNPPANDECDVCKMPMHQDGSNHSGKPTHQQQVDAFCDMMRCELGSIPEQVFNNTKWRIIEVLRDVQKPNNNAKSQGGTVPKKCHCPARFRDPSNPSVCKKMCPFCSKPPKKND